MFEEGHGTSIHGATLVLVQKHGNLHRLRALRLEMLPDPHDGATRVREVYRKEENTIL